MVVKRFAMKTNTKRTKITFSQLRSAFTVYLLTPQRLIIPICRTM